MVCSSRTGGMRLRGSGSGSGYDEATNSTAHCPILKMAKREDADSGHEENQSHRLELYSVLFYTVYSLYEVVLLHFNLPHWQPSEIRMRR